MSYNTFNPIVTNGLIFYVDPINIKSYIGSGTASYDIKELQQGELTNGVGFSNNSFVFDGIDDIINFGSAGLAQDLRGSTEFTINTWIKKTSSTVDFPITAYDGFITTGWFVQWYSDSNIYFGIRNGGIGYNYFGLTWTDEWYNLTFLYDGNQPLDINKAYVFVNAQPATMTNGGYIETSVPTNVIDFIIGGAVNYSGYADGISSATMIYNRVLSPSEISQNYEALKNRFII